MEIEFDSRKSQRNVELRGISFDLAAGFDFDGALEVEDYRDGETRYFALGYIDKRLHALVYTLRSDVIRIISLRKANKREVRRYEQTTRP
ncbi:BrnT family toxin [Litorivivens sp.]|uniref:BrnT family toxin n=1 Tax=Litorivivens sp. TaxID=2020868 RepID=UPI00356AF93E